MRPEQRTTPARVNLTSPVYNITRMLGMTSQTPGRVGCAVEDAGLIRKLVFGDSSAEEILYSEAGCNARLITANVCGQRFGPDVP